MSSWLSRKVLFSLIMSAKIVIMLLTCEKQAFNIIYFFYQPEYIYWIVITPTSYTEIISMHKRLHCRNRRQMPIKSDEPGDKSRNSLFSVKKFSVQTTCSLMWIKLTSMKPGQQLQWSVHGKWQKMAHIMTLNVFS